MARKYRNLINQIIAPDNMSRAYERTARGKRASRSYLEWKEYAEVNLERLADEIATGGYRLGEYRHFMVYEPKPRQIAALSFRDRVAQHALCAVIGPIVDRMLLPRTFACRPGRGTHAGVKTVQSDMRRLGAPLYYLHTDFASYFHSIDRPALHDMIRAKITCAATLRLIETMLPPVGQGIPIGSLTSQYFANLYSNPVDRLLQQELGHKHWVRYMDDIVVLHHDPHTLRATLDAIQDTASRRLHLSLSKWTLAPVTRGLNFLGYRIWPTHKLLRKDSVIRARRAIQALRGRGDTEALRHFLSAWMGHASWADSHHLTRHMGLQA